MPPLLLSTKLYFPPPRSNVVPRPRLIERLDAGVEGKLSLISAPAGFGKTTLAGEWAAVCGRRVAWLSLDAGDNDPLRFVAYLAAAVQSLAPQVGAGVLAALQSPQPPPVESLLTALLNEITSVMEPFVLVMDDYHVIEAQPVEDALAFVLDHQPPQMHLAIATREDPRLPLARLRGRGQLTELRAAELRFTPGEAAEFLNRVMGLRLKDDDIESLERRTEGWIAGLQLAAISMQGREDIAGFIQSFTGSHRFVLDYLVEEVLQQQPENIQTFLLRTSILDRMCAALCEAVVLDPPISGQETAGQETLEYLDRANLFMVPLDHERRWYRYHHLFAELLRQRFGQSIFAGELNRLHTRASEWYERNGLAFEAFRHATAADDVERAERLVEGGGMPLHFRSVAITILDWLASLPAAVLDARPWLWVRFAGLSLNIGQRTGVEEKLQAAEAALAAAPQQPEGDNRTRDLIGEIAADRAVLALSQYQVETILVQSQRALEYLSPANLVSRFTAQWSMGMAHHFRGERAAAARAFADALSIARVSGNIHDTILATICLGQIQELENQLHPAAETYLNVLQLIDVSPLPTAGEAYRGLAQIYYEWNDLDAAEHYGQQGLRLSREYEGVIDRFIITEVFLARLKLARGDAAGAASMLSQTEQTARQKNFNLRLPEIAAAQVLVLLKQGQVAAAAQVAGQFALPLSRARVLLAQGDCSAALEVLEDLRRQMEARGWADERLRAIVLQAVGLHRNGDQDTALWVVGEALEVAEPGGFIRLFVDEGGAMAELLSAAAVQGIRPDYTHLLLRAFEMETKAEQPPAPVRSPSAQIEPLSARELEILGLIAQGLSNQEIGRRLFLALDTIKGHNRRIFDKLHVQSRTEAIARARELGLL